MQHAKESRSPKEGEQQQEQVLYWQRETTATQSQPRGRKRKVSFLSNKATKSFSVKTAAYTVCNRTGQVSEKLQKDSALNLKSRKLKGKQGGFGNC